LRLGRIRAQGRYREGTGKVQGRYREGTGKVQERLCAHLRLGRIREPGPLLLLSVLSMAHLRGAPPAAPAGRRAPRATLSLLLHFIRLIADRQQREGLAILGFSFLAPLTKLLRASFQPFASVREHSLPLRRAHAPDEFFVRVVLIQVGVILISRVEVEVRSGRDDSKGLCWALL
jgi:hypothetical protein